MTCDTSTMSFRVVGSTAREHGHLDVLPERRLERLPDLVEGHVGLAVAALPVAAHFAAGIADEGALEDQHRRMNGREARDVAVQQVLGSGERGLRQVLQSVVLSHEPLDFTPVSRHRKAVVPTA